MWESEEREKGLREKGRVQGDDKRGKSHGVCFKAKRMGSSVHLCLSLVQEKLDLSQKRHKVSAVCSNEDTKLM